MQIADLASVCQQGEINCEFGSKLDVNCVLSGKGQSHAHHSQNLTVSELTVYGWPELWAGISAGTELFLPHQQPYNEQFLLGIQGRPLRPQEEEENYKLCLGESHSPLDSNSTILTCKKNQPVCGRIPLDPEIHVHFSFLAGL